MTTHFYIAELLLRVFAGVLFLYQGYDKLFRIKMPGVIAAFTADAESNHVPKPVLGLVSYYTSIVEFLGGLFLVLGLFTPYVLYALGLDLVLVCLAFSYMNPMWDMKHVFPRLILVVTLLVFPEESHHYSLDHFVSAK